MIIPEIQEKIKLYDRKREGLKKDFIEMEAKAKQFKKDFK